jgi:hypothetical protein
LSPQHTAPYTSIGLTSGDPRSYSDTPHLVGLVWMSDQPVPETSTWQHTTLTRYRYKCLPRDSNPQSQQASGRRPMSWTAQSLGPALFKIHHNYSTSGSHIPLENFTLTCDCYALNSVLAVNSLFLRRNIPVMLVKHTIIRTQSVDTQILLQQIQ